MPSVSGGVCVSLSSCCCARAAEFLPCHYCLQSPLSRVILAPMPLPPLSTQLVATTQRVQDSCDIACMHIVPTVRSQDTSFRHPPASRPAPRASRLALVASRRAVPRGTRLRRAVPHIAPHLHAVEQSHTASRCAAPRAPPQLHRAAWSNAQRRAQSAVAAAPREERCRRGRRLPRPSRATSRAELRLRRSEGAAEAAASADPRCSEPRAAARRKRRAACYTAQRAQPQPLPPPIVQPTWAAACRERRPRSAAPRAPTQPPPPTDARSRAPGRTTAAVACCAAQRVPAQRCLCRCKPFRLRAAAHQERRHGRRVLHGARALPGLASSGRLGQRMAVFVAQVCRDGGGLGGRRLVAHALPLLCPAQLSLPYRQPLCRFRG